MENTAELVREELEKDIFLQNSLSKDIINNSALARVLYPKIKKKNNKATIESITISIARHVNEMKKDRIEEDLVKQISNSQISLKNDIIHACFLRNNIIFNAINETAKKIRWDMDEILFINQGSGEITIVFDKKNMELFSKVLGNAIEVRENCAILSIIESNDKSIKPGIDVPGLYSYFVTQISKKNINILEIISTKTQITFVIKEEDLTNCYEVMNNCIKHFREE